MTNPRYLPREFAVDSRQFGKTEQIEWRSPSEADVMLHAAVMQHHVAVGTRERMRSRRIGKVRVLATELGMDYARLTKLLNGRVVMRLEDVALLRSFFAESEFDTFLVRAMRRRPSGQVQH